MRHRSKHTLFDVGKHQKGKTRTSSTFTLGKNSHLIKKNNKLHSKSTYFYRWGSRINYVVPSMCALALLVGGVVAINPQPNRVYAEEGDGNGTSSANGNGDTDAGIMPLAADSAISLRFNDDASFTAPATANEVAYITNTFTVNVNKYANYTVKLNAMNGSGTELRGKDNAFATIKGVGTNKTIAEFANDTWGYSYQANPDVNTDQKTIAAGLRYNSMPAYGSEEAMVTKNLSGNEENLVDNYLLAFAAKISSNSPADHYIGNFLLSVVGQAFTPETYYLTYNANSGTGGPNQQSCTQTSYQSPCNVVITNEVPTRAGYTFLGWADSASAGSAQYSANSSISLSKSQTLYAVWRGNTFATITRMDQMTPEICAAAEIGDSAQLIDDRDGIIKKYWVTKLKGDTANTKEKGECWMTQNLAYGTVNDTSIGTPCKLSRAENSNAETNATCIDNTSWTNSETDKTFAIGRHEDSKHESQGNYYNWPAAVADDVNPTEPKQGICPNGWRLPTSGDGNTNSKSFGNLVNAYSIGNTGSELTVKPLFFQYGGTVTNGRLDYVGTSGGYWSSTPDTSLTFRARYLGFNSSYVGQFDYANRYTGCSVRCVAK